MLRDLIPLGLVLLYPLLLPSDIGEYFRTYFITVVAVVFICILLLKHVFLYIVNSFVTNKIYLFTNFRNQFTINLRSRFNQLQIEDRVSNPDNGYINFINTHKQATDKYIPLP